MRVVESFTYKDVHGFKFGYHPFAEPSHFTHIYYVDGLLIDTGQSRMSDAVFATLKDLPVEQIFITHHHEDHSGNIQRLRDHFKCPVYGSIYCCEMMKNPPPISFAQWIVWGNRPGDPYLAPIENNLDTQRYSFRLIPIPGHAEDMIALYEPSEGWLFSADLYIHSYIGYFMKAESMATQIQSLQHILTLDFDVLFCSHSPQLRGGRQKLQEKLDFLEGFYGTVADLYHQGFSAKQIFKKLKLKENWPIRILSHGDLTKQNMVISVIRDEKEKSGKFN